MAEEKAAPKKEKKSIKQYKPAKRSVYLLLSSIW